jgi:RNA polymerase sigma-70 factor (ECF subfamily)
VINEVAVTTRPVSMIDSQYSQLLVELSRLAVAVGAGLDAEDVAQEVLLRARARLDQLRDEAKLIPWLRRMIVNEVRQRQRSQGGRVGHLLQFAPVDPSVGLDIAAAIARLPERERLAMTLTYGLGYRQAEAAELLGIRRGTIAAMLFNARRRLALELVEYEKTR